jgi:hypothetical protein
MQYFLIYFSNSIKENNKKNTCTMLNGPLVLGREWRRSVDSRT